LIVALLVAVLAAAPAAFAAAAAQADAAHRAWTSPTVLVEGEPVASPIPPFIERGTTLAPAIPYLSALGFTVTWDAPNGIVLAAKPGLALNWEIDRPEALVQIEGRARTSPLPLAARVVDGVPYVPLRFAAEADRRPVEWHGDDRTVIIGAVQENAPETAARIRIVIPLPDEADFGGTFEPFLGKLADLVQERTGIETEWTMVPRIMYQDKLHLMIASGDLPDLAYLPDPSMYPKGLLSSFAVELSDLIADYPNLSRIHELSLRGAEASSADDGLYGIPRSVSPTDAAFPVIRRDWLDKLGFAVPETMEQLLIVMKGFTERDPDGNGKRDTVGLTGSIEGGGLGTLAWVGHVFNGVPTRFVRQGERIVDTTMLEGTRGALLWLRHAYAEGLLDANFPVKTGVQALHDVQAGRAGIAAMSMTDAWHAEAALRKTTDTAVLTPLVSIKPDDDGPAVASARPALDGMFFVGKQAQADETVVRQALTVLDTLLAAETEDALDVELEAALEAVFGVNAQHELPNPRIPEQDRERYERILTERTSLIDWSAAVFDPEIRARLDNDRKALKQTIDREIVEMMVKVIVGIEPIVAWDAFVEALEKDERYVELMQAIHAGQ
jgi:putative aldouronate transport system substrate-binding protein